MSFEEYRNKRVVVTGCSSGIGLATARTLVALGAQVIGLSRRTPDLELAEFHPVDLTEADSIETAAADVGGRVDALFNCAGAPPVLSSLELVKVNFLGPRMLTERLLRQMAAGAAIVNVSSSVASGWRAHLELIEAFLACGTFQEGVDWFEANETVAGHGYPFSKEALSVWTMKQSKELINNGIRINAISPGAVQTPLIEASEKVFPAELLDSTEQPIGRRSSVAEQVQPLLFLNSSAASYVNGAELAVDGGHSAVQAMDGAGVLG